MVGTTGWRGRERRHYLARLRLRPTRRVPPSCALSSDLALVPDWNRAWEQFLDAYQFEEDIYRRGSDANGIRFANTQNDPEGLVGRCRAAALAKELTVRQYAELRARVRLPGEFPSEADEWLDWKKFGGRLRADMPAELYLQALVFRAFRPATFRFPTYSGESVPLESLEIVPRLLTPVTHDPVTGLMKWEPGLPLDGNGYAIVQGYQVGQDAFRTLRPESFNVADFLAQQEAWHRSSPTSFGCRRWRPGHWSGRT